MKNLSVHVLWPVRLELVTRMLNQRQGGMLDARDLTRTTKPSGQPRARGSVRVRAKVFNDRSVLDTLHQAGSLKVVFPRIADGSLQAVTVNTAGGITGGDRFEATFEAPSETVLTVTCLLYTSPSPRDRG